MHDRTIVGVFPTESAAQAAKQQIIALWGVGDRDVRLVGRDDIPEAGTKDLAVDTEIDAVAAPAKRGFLDRLFGFGDERPTLTDARLDLHRTRITTDANDYISSPSFGGSFGERCVMVVEDDGLIHRRDEIIALIRRHGGQADERLGELYEDWENAVERTMTLHEERVEPR